MADYETGVEYATTPGSDGSAVDSTARSAASAAQATADSNTSAITANTTAIALKADKVTQVIAGAGLTGGGSLAADRTLNVVAGDASIVVSADSLAVGVVSDAQHGTRSGGTLHAAATDSAAGFMSAADHALFTLNQLFNPSLNQLVTYFPNPVTTTSFLPLSPGGAFGTATQRVPDNTNYSTRKSRVAYVSAATASASCGAVFYTAFAGNSGYFSRESGFALKTAVVFGAVSTSMAFCVGVCIGLPAIVTPSALLNVFFLGADTGDTNAQIMYNDGSGTCTKIDLGSNFPARTAADTYDVLFWCAPGSSTINYTVNRHTSAGTLFTASGTITGANVPAAGVQWSPMMCANNGSAGGAIAIDVLGLNMAVPH